MAKVIPIDTIGGLRPNPADKEDKDNGEKRPWLRGCNRCGRVHNTMRGCPRCTCPEFHVVRVEA